MSFSRLHYCYRILGGEPQRSSAIFITSYLWYILSAWLIIVDTDPNHLAEILFFGCFHHKVIHLVSLLPTPNSTLTLWKKVTMSSLHLRSEEPWSPYKAWNIHINYLKFSCKDICLPPPPSLFVCLFIFYISRDSWIFALYCVLPSNMILFTYIFC